MFEDLSLALPFVSTAAESEIDLAALVDAYSTLLFRVANSVVHDTAESEDIVQDVFIRVMKHQRSLPEVRDLRVWLVRIAWNLAIDRHRRHKPEALPAELLHQLSTNDVPADQRYMEAQRLKVVLEAMDRLPALERQVLCLSALDELNNVEIARVVGKSESAVRALLFRARTRLRERLRVKGVK